MFYGDPKEMSRLAFSEDVNNVVSAHRYKIYAPDEMDSHRPRSVQRRREMPAARSSWLVQSLLSISQ